MKVVDQNVQIDGIDKKILRALMADARTPILEIARGVGVSGAAIHQRHFAVAGTRENWTNAPRSH